MIGLTLKYPTTRKPVNWFLLDVWPVRFSRRLESIISVGFLAQCGTAGAYEYTNTTAAVPPSSAGNSTIARAVHAHDAMCG